MKYPESRNCAVALSTSNSSATDFREGEMMVKPTALHPMVSISNQIGALATGTVFLDEGSKKFPLY